MQRLNIGLGFDQDKSAGLDILDAFLRYGPKVFPIVQVLGVSPDGFLEILGFRCREPGGDLPIDRGFQIV